MSVPVGPKSSLPLNAINSHNLIIGIPEVRIDYPDDDPLYPYTLDEWNKDRSIALDFAGGLEILISDYLKTWPYNRSISVKIDADAEIIKLGTSKFVEYSFPQSA